MTKIRFLFVFAAIVFATSLAQLAAQVSTWDGTHTPWTHGTGTEDDPFLIESAQQLAYLTYRVNNGLDAAGGHVSNSDYHYKLMTDIDLNGSEEFQWTPIGYYNSSSDYQCFGGHFDGNNHTISGVHINNSTLSYVGLFGYTDGATVKNLAVSGTTVTSTKSNSYAGGIIGAADGTIDVTDCSSSFSGNISSSYYAGGIIGYVTTATITNCYNTGNVSSSSATYYRYSGGILGYASSTATITNCYNTGNVSSSVSGGHYSYSGGILGYARSTATITNCYNTGNVSSSSSGNSFSGGILGYAGSTTTITNCYNTGNVSSSSGGNNYRCSGGILGYASSTATITNCYNTGNVSSSSDSGGVVGYTVSVNVSNSYYLNTCGGSNSYGGQPMSADAMRSEEFLGMLANGSCAWAMDTEPYINDGYPVLTMIQMEVHTYDATNVTQTAATLNGSITVMNDEIISAGFMYKQSDAENYTSITCTSTTMTYTMTDLEPVTNYTYKAYLQTVGCGTVYGEEKTFRTIPPWDGSYSPWTQGSGTEDDPYLIENAQHLAYLAYRVNNGLEDNSKYYKVVADIDLYGSEDFQWTPIGNSRAFRGHFDGGNHTIYGMYVSGEDYAGLFGYASGATIINTNVRGSLVSGRYAGGIVGRVQNCNVTSCSNKCSISSSRYAGGIVGYAEGTTDINNCYNKGSVSCSNYAVSNSEDNDYSGYYTYYCYSYSGGIIGYCYRSDYSSADIKCRNCYNRGNVNSYSGLNAPGAGSYGYVRNISYSGGIIGYGVSGSGSINCYNTGNITSQSLNNDSYGTYYASSTVGGILCGYGNINNCYYLNTCGDNSSNGGTAMASDAMQDANFVDLLNDNSCVWQQDTEPFENDGYPTLTALLYNAYTERATEVADVSATLHGHIEVGNATVTSKGFEYKKASESEYTVVNVTAEGNTLTVHLSGLDPNTTYYYRAFVKVAECEYTSYGSQMNFTVSYFNVDTIRIYDAEMLQWVADMCNRSVYVEGVALQGSNFAGKYIKLMNNIVLPLNQPNNMSSIGSYPDHPFKGTFDGNGKLITNLYIDQPNTPYQGFFGYTLDANLYNVGLVNITASGRNYTGGMVAYAENTNMRDCYVNGGSLFALSYCGGLVGYQTPGTNSIISGCYNTCTVSGNHYVGGLLGYSDYGTVRNSYVAASVAAQGEAVGSIIGGANEVLMYQCYFSSEITGQENAIGENNFKSNEGMTNEQMRDPQFVETLNQGLTVPVWKGDYEQPINSGFPILKWQYSDIETCGAPENLTSIINGNSITLIWTGEENVDYYIVEYGLAGEQAQTETTTRNTISFNYEQPGSYYWRVKSVCPFGESNFVNGENVVIGGIEEIGGIQQIGIYPNPASESVTIQSEGQNDLEQINVFDVNGRMVMSESATGQIHRLDISNLQQGIYFVKVQTSDGYMTNKKLIVQ